MAYFAPYIDETGYHAPTYQDIVEDLVQQSKNIYGQDIYLENDSQDYQFISVFALKMNDALNAVQLVYDSRGPGTAIGAALDGLIKLNGIKRNPQNPQSAYSSCVVTLTGTVNTPISNGVVQDISGNKWNLPAIVTIGTGGTVDVTIVSQAPGAILASARDISIIVTPAYGWVSVVNANDAVPGVPIESDSQLKSRQAISTAQPSLTVLEGTEGNIAAVTGVTRQRVYENDTGTTDSRGLPGHCIAAVVEGGADVGVALAIFNKKGPGCYTDGTTPVDIVDKFGQITTIRFYRPTYVDLGIVINVHKLTGYTTSTTVAIQTSVAKFLNSMKMGVNDIPVNNFFGPALLVQDLNSPIFSVTSITAARYGQNQDTADIITVFNEALRGNISYIEVNAT